jgi:uncharacterized membrane protein YeiH
MSYHRCDLLTEFGIARSGEGATGAGPVMTHLGALFDTVDLISVLFGAIAGGLIARARPDYDITGVMGIAIASGIGGGILRDLLLADGPPFAIAHQQYLLMCLLGGALAFVIGSRLVPVLKDPISTAINVIAFGSFTMAAGIRALNAGLGVLAVLLLCVVGSSTGSLVRDLLLGTPMELFRKGQLIAIAAVIGGIALLLCDAAGLPTGIATAAGALVAMAVRVLAIRFNIETPLPRSKPAPHP